MPDDTTNKPLDTDQVDIILDRSRHSRSFDCKESLWKPEIGRILDLLSGHLTALPTGLTHDSTHDGAPCLSLGIFGHYGSGKSSLLRTVADLVNSQQANDRAETASLPGWSKEFGMRKTELERIRALPTIEPRHFSRDDNLLYAFLALALDADEALRAKNISTRHGSNAMVLSPVQQAFQGVSDYLQAIDDKARSGEFDPLGASLERLERHTSSQKLRDRIGQFIDRLVQELDVKFLLLPIDDADMSLEGLKNLLETYRRYLLHPRLVSVFAFTAGIAETMLRGHFSNELKNTATVPDSSGNRAYDDLAEQLAFQYMTKLFPARNRISLGAAPARIVEHGVCKPDAGEPGDHRETEVKTLLARASSTLFGRKCSSEKQRIHKLLRPSRVRPQLQVIDAIYDASDQGQAIATRPGWGESWSEQAWALLSVHYDALRYFHVRLETLHNRTPYQLRRKVLASVLDADPEAREQLVKCWTYDLEDRGSQALSLCVAEIFRPRMPGEEPTGDYYPGDPKIPRDKLSDHDRYGFSLGRALRWFVNVWLGFYLPLVLSHDRSALGGTEQGRGALAPIRATGWAPPTGPIHAARRALRFPDEKKTKQSHDPAPSPNEQPRRHATGMVFYPVAEFTAWLGGPDESQAAQPDGDQPETNWSVTSESLRLRMWSCYGYDDGRPWAALSLWRCLGFMALVIRQVELDLEQLARDDTFTIPRDARDWNVHYHQETSHPDLTDNPDNQPTSADRSSDRPRIVESIQRIIREQLRTAVVPGQFSTDHGSNRFPVHYQDTYESWVKALCRAIMVTWLPRVIGKRLVPCETSQDATPDDGHCAWLEMFIRRLHGDSLLGSLWRDLGTLHFAAERSDAGNIAKQGWITQIEQWRHCLDRYWNERDGDAQEAGSILGQVIAAFPLFHPILTITPPDSPDQADSPPSSSNTSDLP